MIRNKQEGIVSIEPSELQEFLSEVDGSRFHVARVNNVADGGKSNFSRSKFFFTIYMISHFDLFRYKNPTS
jgi:hypothetical protein